MSIRDGRVTLWCDTEDCDENIDASLVALARPGNHKQLWEEPDYDYAIRIRGWSIVGPRQETYCPSCTKKRARAAKRAANKTAREAG